MGLVGEHLRLHTSCGVGLVGWIGHAVLGFHSLRRRVGLVGCALWAGVKGHPPCGLERHVAPDLHRVQAGRMGQGALRVRKTCLLWRRWSEVHWGAGWGHTPCAVGVGERAGCRNTPCVG